jgi:hypothetical protein
MALLSKYQVRYEMALLITYPTRAVSQSDDPKSKKYSI